MAFRMPRISICVPHWQVRGLAAMCLRSIRRHSAMYDLEILVVDNGSRDDSLEYLRSLPWIRLIERPEEGCANWPANVFTAWDLGLRQATGDFFVTLHTDVLVRRNNWLDSLLSEFTDPQVAAAGAWKLELEHPLYLWQKEVLGRCLARLKQLAGLRTRGALAGQRYPRDYCAMYRRETLLQNNITFCPAPDEITGGYAIARQLWERGYVTRVIPTLEMACNVIHVAHGTAALAASEKPLHHRSAQRKVESRVARLFAEPWVRQLRDDVSLDQV